MLSPKVFVFAIIALFILSVPALAQNESSQNGSSQNVLQQILEILKKIIELLTQLISAAPTVPRGAYGYVMIDPTGDATNSPNLYAGDYAASSDIGACGKYQTLSGMTAIIKKKDGSYCKEVPVNVCRTVQGTSHPFYQTGEKLPPTYYSPSQQYTISLNLPDGWTFALRKSEENNPPESQGRRFPRVISVGMDGDMPFSFVIKQGSPTPAHLKCDGAAIPSTSTTSTSTTTTTRPPTTTTTIATTTTTGATTTTMASNIISACSENFDEPNLDLTKKGWNITEVGNGTIRISSENFFSKPNSLKMDSPKDPDPKKSSAYAISPSCAGLDYNKPYTVTLNFLTPTNDNHFFDVFTDRYIQSVIEPYTFLCRYGGKNKYFDNNMKTDYWYSLKYIVDPTCQKYQIFLDGNSLGECEFSGESFGGLAAPTTYRLGDDDVARLTSDSGKAYWDNIVISQTGSLGQCVPPTTTTTTSPNATNATTTTTAFATTTTTSAGLPDLTAKSTGNFQGSFFSTYLNFSVTNSGTADAGAFDVNITVSNKTSYWGDLTWYTGKTRINSLAAGAMIYISFNVTNATNFGSYGELPSYFNPEAGINWRGKNQYYINITADNSNEISESNENNNMNSTYVLWNITNSCTTSPYSCASILSGRPLQFIGSSSNPMG